MITRKATFACGMALAAAGALVTEAKAAEGFYAGVHGGAVFLGKASLDDHAGTVATGTGTVTGTGTLTLSNIEQEFDRGFAVGAEAGYAFGNGLRIGGEVTYRHNDLGDISADLSTPSGSSTSTSGNVDEDISSWAFMLNGYFDIATGSPFTPYVGVGAGAAIVSLDLETNLGDIDDSDTVFAYQGIVGLAFALSQNIDIGVEYRYFATSDPEFSGDFDTSAEYRAHNVFLKATYHM
jgi:opacity protein-like surface antigen